MYAEVEEDTYQEQSKYIHMRYDMAWLRRSSTRRWSLRRRRSTETRHGGDGAQRWRWSLRQQRSTTNTPWTPSQPYIGWRRRVQQEQSKYAHIRYKTICLRSSERKTYSTRVVWNDEVKLLLKRNFILSTMCQQFDEIRLKMLKTWTRNTKLSVDES